MITSATNSTKKKNKTKQMTDRTLGQMVKAVIYTDKITQCPPPQFWDDSLSIQVFQRCRVHQVDCGD